MSYYDVLVHIDNSKACHARLAAALKLADEHKARLHGHVVIPPPSLAFYGDVPAAADVIQGEIQRVEDDVAKAEAAFRDAVAGAALETTCSAVQGSPGALLAEAARECDLAVVGQHDPEDSRCTSHGVAAAVAFGAGAGVLVHPCRGDFVPIGRRVLIAWNGLREAQRAVREAGPFLRLAERVEVISVITSKMPEGEDSARRLCANLSRRGIEAHIHYVSAADEDVGEVLVARCTNADLLVLGAYGHSRLRELLLGGVTRSILQGQAIPLLIAH